MRILSPTVHGVLDYVVVAAFAPAPSLLGLSGIAAQLSWALAGIHLALTVLTAFPLGLIKVIPFTIHGWIELAVGPLLVASPFLLGFEAAARTLYVGAGVVVLLVWAITRYSGDMVPATAPPQT